MVVDNAKIARAQEIDENGRVVQGGTTMEIQVLTCTKSSMLGINFSELPKGIIFQTRSAATDVEFTFATATVGNGAGDGYWTMKAGETLSIDCASTGTYYFRNSAANQDSIIIGLALL